METTKETVKNMVQANLVILQGRLLTASENKFVAVSDDFFHVVEYINPSKTLVSVKVNGNENGQDTFTSDQVDDIIKNVKAYTGNGNKIKLIKMTEKEFYQNKVNENTKTLGYFEQMQGK